jgi:hypothetical protein
MNKNSLIVTETGKGRSFELLLATTLKSLQRDNLSYMSQEASHLLSKPELIELVKSFQPEDSIELLLVLQFLVGYLWSAEKLSHGYSFESFTNLSLRAGDLLIRYKAIKLKKNAKNVIPHETVSDP